MNGKELMRDRFRGCLLGGAAGDALGYEVEFMNEMRIKAIFGEEGIRRYELHGGAAIVSDDTQMTLFTANGLLCGAAAGCSEADYTDYIGKCYLDWLKTQRQADGQPGKGKMAWLNGIARLNCRRAPGNTCLSALMSGQFGTINDRINNSKGCGGVMRTAPAGLMFKDAGLCQRVGAAAAAITHGHELGFLPAALLSGIVHVLVNRPETSVKDAVLSAMDTLRQEFADVGGLQDMIAITEQALDLAESQMKDQKAIHLLGEGWVGDEALAIAVYCAAKYENDFESCIVAAVNHRGDSDSTGAIAGNILGAKLGASGIEEHYLTDLEMRAEIESIADDLLEAACELSGGAACADWRAKYIGEVDAEDEQEDEDSSTGHYFKIFKLLKDALK